MANDLKAEAKIVLKTDEAEKGAKRFREKAKEAADGAAKDTAAAAERAARDQERANNRRTSENEKSEKKRSSSSRRETEKRSGDERREEDKRAREYERYQEKLSRINAQEAARRAQQELRTEEKNAAARKKLWNDHFTNVRKLATGAVVGAVAGGAVAIGTARGISGIQDVSTRISNANQFRERLIVSASQAGMDPNALQGQVLGASKSSRKDSMELLGVLEAGQAKFNDLKFFADNLEKIAITSKAAGADAGSLAEAVGYARQAFGLTSEEAMQAMDLMVAGAAKGSIELKDFAKDFAPVAGIFAQNMGAKGLGGFRQFIGTAQAGGTLGAGSAETATMVERLTANLAEKGTRDKLRSVAGINVKDMSMQQIIAAMSNSKRFNAAGAREKIFGQGDVITNKAITALIGAYRRTATGQDGAIDIGSIANVDAAAGAAQTSKTFGALVGSGALDLQSEANRAQNDTIENLKLYNGQVFAVTKASSDLAESFGDLGRTIGLWKDGLAAGGIGGAATSLLQGSSGSGGILATTAQLAGSTWLGAKLAAGGSAASAAGGIAGIAGTAALWGGGALAAGGLGYGVGKGIDAGIEALFGKALSTWLGEMASSGVDSGRSAITSRGKSGDISSQGGAVVTALNEVARNTRELPTLNRALQENLSRPGARVSDRTGGGL